MVRDSFVVTDTVLYPAKGMIFRFKLYTCSKIQHYSVFYRKCFTVECQGELHYDAQSQSCLLDMGIFLWCMRYFGDNYVVGRSVCFACISGVGSDTATHFPYMSDI